MIRVLMFVPQYPYPVVGGLERQSHELSKALAIHGVSVQVISGKIFPGQPVAESVEGVPVTRIPWSNHRAIRFLRSPFDIFFTLWRKRTTFDVIHLHQHSWVGLYVILVSKLLGKPILTKLPNVGNFGIPGMFANRFGRLKLALLLWSDGLVAMSQQSLDELQEVGYPAGRILATPNGIRLSNEQSADDMMNEQTNASCKVVFVGRLMEQKRLDTLLEAWRNVVDLLGPVPVLELWGDGPLLQQLRQVSHELGLCESVIFRGHVGDVRSRLKNVGVFVLPSGAEGNSNAILEAMDAGLPIVSTRIGGTSMMVGDEGAPFLFDVGDTDTLAHHLITLLQSPTLRRKVGKAMRRRIEMHFDLNKVALTYQAAYYCLAQGRRDELRGLGILPEVSSDRVTLQGII